MSLAAGLESLPRAAHADFDVRERSLTECFDRQVRLHGDRSALEEGGRATSYSELYASALGTAGSIRAALGNARPGERVVLLLEEPALEVECLLAVLASGHAFVPLDPKQPESRLRATIGHAEPALILTNGAGRELAARVANGVGVLDVTSSSGDLVSPVEVPASAPAAILYTSGSTGEPKGVVHTHASLLHAFLSSTNGLGLSAEDRLTLLGATSFAATLSDVFGALLNGAALLPYRVSARGIAGLSEYLLDSRATVYFSVPSLFRRFTDLLEPDRVFSSLRVVKLAGEPMRLRDVERFRRHCRPGALLVNSLGCTEINIVRQFRIDHGTEVPWATVPVGYPVAGTDVVLVDADGREVADGDTGEIEVRSRWLADGYWRSAEATARAFRDLGGKKCAYRTGDLGRIVAPGLLEHLGRKDFQLKVAGVRVDPGEVETKLVDLGFANEAVVVGQADAGGETRLVAYFVPPGPALETAELRRRLLEELPVAMVPGVFVPLDALPRLPNGKIDRACLPRSAQVPLHRAPGGSDQLEDAVVKALSSAIGRGGLLGPDDDFFAEGGSSLGALVACARIEQLTRRKVLPTELLTARTPRALARAIRERRGHEHQRSLVALRSGGSRPPFFCVHPWGGHVFCYAEVAAALAPDIPFYGLQARGLDGDEAPDLTLGSMAAHYVSEIRSVQPTGPYYLGGFCFGGLVAMEMAQMLTRAGEAVGLLALMDTAIPPRLPARVVKLGERVVRSRHPVTTLAAAAKAAVLRSVTSVSARAPLVSEAAELPPSLRRVWHVMHTIRAGYRPPRRYAGRLLIVESAVKDPELPSFGSAERSWLRISEGQVERVILPVLHRALFTGEGATLLARVLSERLASAQSSGF